MRRARARRPARASETIHGGRTSGQPWSLRLCFFGGAPWPKKSIVPAPMFFFAIWSPVAALAQALFFSRQKMAAPWRGGWWNGTCGVWDSGSGWQTGGGWEAAPPPESGQSAAAVAAAPQAAAPAPAPAAAAPAPQSAAAVAAAPQATGRSRSPSSIPSPSSSSGQAAAAVAAAPKAPGTAAVAAVQVQGVAYTPGPTSPMGQPHEVTRDAWDFQFFTTLKKEKRFTAGARWHNAALKWFRDSCERDGVAQIIFSNQTKAAVADITHPKGMDYSFDESKTWQWSWWEMVAMLDHGSREYVVGLDRSGGLVACRFEPRPNSYDHKRHHAGQGTPDTKMRIWDFVLIRKDGSGVRLHPAWKTTKVESFAVEGHEEEVPIPSKGLGKSDGPGTYRAYKDIGSDRTLRFG